MRANIQRVLVISLLIASCAPGFSAEDLHATALQLAGTGVALTLTALPSNTIPPTTTETPIPSSTITASETAVPTDTATFAPTWTPFGQFQPTDFATDKADKADQNAPLLLQNNSGETITFILLSPVYQEYEFSKNMTLILPEATYTYRAWIGNKGPMNGTFSITNGDKHVLIFYEDKIHFSTP